MCFFPARKGNKAAGSLVTAKQYLIVMPVIREARIWRQHQ